MNRINETESPHAELRDDVIFFGGIVAFAFTAFAVCYFLWALFDFLLLLAWFSSHLD